MVPLHQQQQQQLEEQLLTGTGPVQRAKTEAVLQALSHYFNPSLQQQSADEPSKPAVAAGEHVALSLSGCPRLTSD